MCYYFSCVVTKTAKVFWSMKTNNHENLIEDNNLDDTKITDQKICRIEITPPDENYNLPANKWILMIDEDNKPDWFTDKHEKACYHELRKSMKRQVFHEGCHEISNQFAIACGSSTVKAYGSSTVTACDSSTAKAYGNSTIKAYDSSTAKAYGNSTIEAYDNSTVRAHGNSTITACGSSTVKAYGSSTVTAYGSSTVRTYGSSTAKAYGSSIIYSYCKNAKKLKLLSETAVIIDAIRNRIIVSKSTKISRRKTGHHIIL